MTTLVPSFLYGSSSIMQVTRTPIHDWLSLIFVKIPPPITELAAIECLKNQYIML